MIRHILRLIALVAGTALALATLASPPTAAQAPAGGGSVAFTNARIIDGTGRAPIDRGTLVIANGRVAAVGPAASVMIPAGAQRIDAAGKTIVPGFINAHAHLNVSPNAPVPVREDLIRRLRMYANYGVTSTVSLGSTRADEAEGFKLMQEQDHPGLDRARLYTAGLNAVGKTPEEARASVDRLADLHAYLIKFHINGTPNDMNEATWSAIIDESHKKGLRVAVHIFYQKDAKAAIDHGVDIIAHGIRDEDVSPEVIAEMKRKNVGYIPTLTRDVAVYVYESTPDFLKDPFFQRGSSLYNEQVPMLTTPEWQDKVRKDATAQMTFTVGCDDVPEVAKIVAPATYNLDSGPQLTLDSAGSSSGIGDSKPIASYLWQVVSGPASIARGTRRSASSRRCRSRSRMSVRILHLLAQCKKAERGIGCLKKTEGRTRGKSAMPLRCRAGRCSFGYCRGRAARIALTSSSGTCDGTFASSSSKARFPSLTVSR